MDYLTDEKTTVNVKAVSVRVWEITKLAANRQNNSLGEWVSRACANQANLESGPLVFPPLDPVNLSLKTANPDNPDVVRERLTSANPDPKTANPVKLDAAGLVSLMQGIAALAAATGVMPNKTNIRRAYAVADDMVREGGNLPPRTIQIRVGKASGKARPENGQSELIQSKPANRLLKTRNVSSDNEGSFAISADESQERE